MMFDADAALDGLRSELEQLTFQRDELERRIAGIQQSIHGIMIFKNKTFGGKPVTPISTSSLTDATRALLKATGVPLTAIKVKEGLEISGYDFSGYKSNPLASIHTVLKRLDHNGEVTPVSDGQGRIVAYQWNRR